MKVSDVLQALRDFAPEALKEDWDNVGLLLGRQSAEVTGALVALDPTEAVAQEAERLGCELVVTHHSLIFGGLKAVTDAAPMGERVLAYAERKIAVISMHTNLDCAQGGVNDALAQALGLHNIEILDDGETAGLVRMGEVRPQPLRDFAAFVKERLGCEGLRYADGGRAVRRVAVGGGACGEFLPQVKAAGCDTFVTADLKYHEFCDAAPLGVNLIDAGHFCTEDPVCGVLEAELSTRLPGLRVARSRVHGDCVRYL